MINTLKKLFGLGPKVDYADLVKQGAVILDVVGRIQTRTYKRSLNTPLNDLSRHITKLKRDATIITCCASGMQKCFSKSILKSNGFISCITAEAGVVYTTNVMCMVVEHFTLQGLYWDTSIKPKHSFRTFSRFFYTKS
jgi:rhodanese-related sulfurtransferase